MIITKKSKQEIKSMCKEYSNEEWSANIRADGSLFGFSIGSRRTVSQSFSLPTGAIGAIHSHPTYVTDRLAFSCADYVAALTRAIYAKQRGKWYEFVVSSKTGSILGMRIDGTKIIWDEILQLKKILREGNYNKFHIYLRKLRQKQRTLIEKVSLRK